MSRNKNRTRPTARQLTQARKLLDRCRAGEPVTIAQINQALEMTGDLEHVDCSLAEVAA